MNETGKNMPADIGKKCADMKYEMERKRVDMMDEYVDRMTVGGLRKMFPVMPIDIVIKNNPDMSQIEFYRRLKYKFRDDDEAMELIRGLVTLYVLPKLYGNGLCQEILDEFGLDDVYGDMAREIESARRRVITF